MLSMAVPAMSRFDVAQSGNLRVKSVEVGGVALFVAIAACRRGVFLPRGRTHARDLVRRVAIATDGHLRVAGLKRPSVDPGEIGGLRPGVAGTAGCGDIRPVRPAFGIRAAQDLMSTVATGAGGGNQQAILGERETVDGIHVQRIDIGKAKFPRRLRISMTRSTSFGYV